MTIATVSVPKIEPPVLGKTLTPEEFAHGKGATTTMVFEKTVLFTPMHGVRVRYSKGIHEVPEQYATHWYLVANEARVYNRPVAAAAQKPAPAAQEAEQKPAAPAPAKVQAATQKPAPVAGK